MTYSGRVRVIYIDPPYNTGNRDWVYNDHFVSPEDRFRHSQWLDFMHRRLQLAQELLAPDGAIFVSVDDNEGPYLKALLDQVFTRLMFVTSFIWRKVDSPNDNKVKVAPDHEYIHCYASERALARWRRLSSDSILDAFSQRDEKNRLYRDRLLRKNGKSSLRTDRPTMWFALQDPDGNDVWPIRDDKKEGRWSHAKKGIDELKKENRLIWKQVTARLCCKPCRGRSGWAWATEDAGRCRTSRGVTSRVRSCSGRSVGIAAMG
jgi:adenine-specific DNA-methyltransferase